MLVAGHMGDILKGLLMRHRLLTAAMMAALATTALPQAAFAQPHRDYRWHGDSRDDHWDPSDHYRAGKYRERRLSRNDRVYRGRDGRYYCKRSDGSTGLVIGALAGGALGNAVGGSTLSTLLGAAGGGVLGREIDRGKVKCR
jgi:hypothetical protein